MKLLSHKLVSALATYDIGKSIGDGGAGVVFAAVRDDAADVAIKVLRPLASARDKLKRFRNELHFCLRTTDPHIVPVSDFGMVSTDEGDATFYVMPRYPGTLRSRMNAGVLPRVANALASSLLDSVEAAHMRRVWHRDLKPENFLASAGSESLVLSDFGAAHFHADLLVTSVETAPGERLANFEYAAPEQRRKGITVDHRCDLYAIGLMIHELFTGEVPHGKGHRLIADVAPEYSYLDEIVEWLTQHEPVARPTSIDEVRLRLLALHKEVSARRQLAVLENKIITTVDSDDPLIKAPPKLMSIDVQGRTLHLALSTTVTSQWIQAFQNTDYHTSLMGAAPPDFSFSGSQASLGFRYNEPTAETVQRVVDDFKRFLGLGATAYQHRVTRELRRKEEEARKRKETEIKEERRRLDLLRKVKI